MMGGGGAVRRRVSSLSNFPHNSNSCYPTPGQRGLPGNSDATYGSLGAAIGMMMWMWISTIVVLFGGELNSEIEHQTTKDNTAKPR
jgi:hypothetical protein